MRREFCYIMLTDSPVKIAMLNALDLFIVALVALFIYWLRLKPFRDFASKVPGYNGIKSLRNCLSLINIHPDGEFKVRQQ